MGDFDSVGRWLDLTGQQFDVLKAIYSLQSKGSPTKPKAIFEEYSQVNKRYLQKSNLFGLLRELVARGYVSKTAGAKYVVEFAGIQSALVGKRDGLRRDLTAFERALSDAESFFREYVGLGVPRVSYLPVGTLYSKMAESVPSSQTVYGFAKFPAIAYTNQVAGSLDRLPYAEALWEYCLRRKSARICYLTELDVDQLFNYCLQVFGEPAAAFKEASIVVDQLENMIGGNSNLDVRFLENPLGLYIMLPVAGDEVVDRVFLLTRDEHGSVIGGIHIQSRDISARFHDSYMRKFDHAEKLKPGAPIFDASRNLLKQKYGVLTG